MSQDTIPAIWRIDVEPDEFQPKRGAKPWQGFLAMAELVEELRERLAHRSGSTPHPCWFLRLDPDVERCFGRLDFVVRRHEKVFNQLTQHADVLGIHVHAYRWDGERKVTFSDYADEAWPTHCLTVAAETFSDCFGEPARRVSQGGYFLSHSLLESAVSLGIEVDVSIEPGLRSRAADTSFGAYATAPSSDYRAYPRRPFYPSRVSLAKPGPRLQDAYPILMVPLTSYDYRGDGESWHRKLARRVMNVPSRPLPLNPWKSWPSPKIYWDMVERAVDEQPVRYFAFAMRTDAPCSNIYRRVRQLLSHLPEHPIAARLNFVDPLSPELRALAIPSPGNDDQNYGATLVKQVS